MFGGADAAGDVSIGTQKKNMEGTQTQQMSPTLRCT